MVSCKQGTFAALGIVGVIFGALTIGLYSYLYDAILQSVRLFDCLSEFGLCLFFVTAADAQC